MANIRNKSLASATDKAKKAEQRAGTTRISSGTGSRAIKEVTFGAVTISASAAHAGSTKANIKSGQEALARAAERLSKPGVSISVGKNVPLYYIDQKYPDEIVRVLNGKKARGVLKNGVFKVTRS